MQISLAKRLRNGKSTVRIQPPRWMILAIGLITAGVALAPWWAGGLYVGPRPVAPEEALWGLLWSADFPLMGRALVGLLIIFGFLACAWRIEMWRFPVGRILLPFVGLITWMGVSMAGIGVSWNGVRRVTDWVLMLLVLVSVPAVARRNSATGWLVWGLVISATLLGLRACTEYLQNAMSGITNWRVFGSFFNPNLLAGYLAMSAPLTMGVLMQVGRNGSTVHARWLPALLTVGLWLQVAGLVLTASRLGLVAFLIACSVLLLLSWAWKLLTREFIWRLGVVGVLLGGVIWLSQPATQRLTPQVASQDVHSGAFRIETWKGVLRMVLSNPIFGVGPGDFEVDYPRYALVGYTRSAHNSYLELASESGFPALLLLVVIGIGWLSRVLQTEIPPKTGRVIDWRPIRVGVLAGVVGAVAHNAVDSDLQVVANGLMLACLLALGVALAPDGVFTVPLRPMERRGGALVLAATVGLGLVSSGLGEWYANTARYYALIHQVPQAVELYQTARVLDSRNPDYLMELGELYYALGRRETAFQMMEQAIRWKPSPRNWYRLGLYYEREGQADQAEQVFRRVVDLDPNNLPALLKLAQKAQGDPNNPRLTPEALRYYERAIAIEQSRYGQIRAVPEMVETAYGFAHLALARHYESLGKIPRALQEYESALKVFRAYRERTYPFNLQGSLLGLYNPEREQQILQAHLTALRHYAQLLERIGRASDAERLRQEYAKLVSGE